jgi:vitamin B12 transporter
MMINRSYLCSRVFAFNGILLLSLFFSVEYKAQDTLHLKSIEVVAPKKQLSETGKKVEKIDSLYLEQFRYSQVADLISLNSPVFVKSYGPGAVSTTAFRGGNAGQTAVLWNNFNLQNTMLGQSDLALLPSILFEEVTIEYGGSSSLWGSGAIGGSIRLDNRHLFGQGDHAKLNFGAGTTGLLNASANIVLSRKKFIASTKFYDIDSKNNYRYHDTSAYVDTIKKMKNAAYHFQGIMQEFKFLPAHNQVVQLNIWLNRNKRKLPLYDRNMESRTYQDDDAARFTADWSISKYKLRTVLKAGYFADRINYTDSLINLFSRNIAHILIGENENYYSWNQDHQLNFGFNYTTSKIISNNYEEVKLLSKFAILAGQRSYFFNSRLLIYISGRAEYFSAGRLPVTGNVAAELKVTDDVTALVNVARVYRHPTLNDLYWQPGGNPDLLPEEGVTSEGSLEFKKVIKAFEYLISGSAYSRVVHNWISWVPGFNGSPRPANIQKVWSRGTESTMKIQYRKNKFRLTSAVRTGYNLSTVIQTSLENSEVKGRQLIYTPRYSVNGNIGFGIAGFDITFFYQYNGYRFTTSDNSQWLPPYKYITCRMNYRHSIDKLDLIFFTGCNNLLNENYMIINGNPMPLRNFEFGISLLTKPIKKQT